MAALATTSIKITDLPPRELTNFEKIFSHLTNIKTPAGIQAAFENLQKLGFKNKSQIDSKRLYAQGLLIAVSRGAVLRNSVLIPYFQSLDDNFSKANFFERYLKPLLGEYYGNEKEDDDDEDGFIAVEQVSLQKSYETFAKLTNLKFILSQLKETNKDGTPNLSKDEFSAYINEEIDKAYLDKNKSSRIIIPCIVSHDKIDHNVTIVIDTNHTKDTKENPQILFFDPKGYPINDTTNNKIGRKKGYTIQAIVNDIKAYLATKSNTTDPIQVIECPKVQTQLFVCGDHNILLSTQLAAGYSFTTIRDRLMEHNKVEEKVRRHAANVLKMGYDSSIGFAQAGAAAAAAVDSDGDDF
jgi:hypothetical protein